MHKCLTCGTVSATLKRHENHVIKNHLPLDWKEEDLEHTSEEETDVRTSE